MPRISKFSLTLCAAVAIGIIFSLVVTQTILAEELQVADMNDRFATEKGANGFAGVRLTQDEDVEVDRVAAGAAIRQGIRSPGSIASPPTPYTSTCGTLDFGERRRIRRQ